MSSSLHNHSEYSFLDGFSHPKEYLEEAVRLGLKAFAITEHGNQYSWVYFDKLKKDYPSIKMIYGVEFYECFDMKVKDVDSKYFHLIALAKNENGRIALNELITKSNFEGFYFKPRIDLGSLKPYANDLIILSACIGSKLGKELDYNKCIDYVNEYKSIFPNFFLEMQSHDTVDQDLYNKKILQLSIDTNTLFTITTDSHSATEKDLYYQAKHVQIARDDDTSGEFYNGCYLQSDDEIHKIMDNQIGLDNVIKGLKNSDLIADMIDNVDMPFQDAQLPTYPLPLGFNTNEEYLRYLVEKGWKTRKIDKMNKDEQKIRRDRLEYELKTIHDMGFDGYFLIVWDLINYAKTHNIIVGDGRGSGGGALTNYLLEISELDPITYDLIFERFLNPERVSMPDIDIDFADRESIINYLTSKYGEDRVCQIINFSYITPIVAIKDVGRVLKIPYNITDKISKRFTYETFDECIDNNPSLYEEYVDYKELFDVASKISGRVRNASIHAGGVGIVDTKITDYMAMKLGSKGEHVIQVDKKIIESIGIIKFDILGVATLAVIQEVMNDIGLTPYDISINNPLFRNDKKMYELLQKANTNGVFQVESQGMKDLLLRLCPTSLEDISAVLALYRPDSMSMLEDYIYYKHNEKDIKYWHEDMRPLLEKTYGCIIYQEEIMDIVRVIGGRTRGGADKFRKGIGKKDKAMVKKEADTLYKEIIQNGYDEPLAKKISEYMSTMGGYSFNKSHSALYGILTLKTAYLKANYPAYFFKALLNKSIGNFGVLNKYIIDAKDFGVEVLPPNINESQRNFSVVDGKILFGLEAIKGIGQSVVDEILEQRKISKFKGFKDLKSRIKMSDAVVVTLTKAGAIPCKNKKDFLIKYAKSKFENKEYKDVSSLPKLSILNERYGIDCNVIKDKNERLRLYNNIRREEYNSNQQTKYENYMNEFNSKHLLNEDIWEFEALSIFINNNPFEKAYSYITSEFENVEEGSDGIIVGVISSIQKKKDKNGKQFGFVWVYSIYGLIEAICWHTQFKENEHLLKRGEQVALLCRKSNDKPVVKSIKSYSQWIKDRELNL